MRYAVRPVEMYHLCPMLVRSVFPRIHRAWALETDENDRCPAQTIGLESILPLLMQLAI
jgi:hypothetical protein